jgi:hypothetical protein
MTQDEMDILSYFKANPKIWVKAKELARQVGGKFRYEQNPDWTKPVLKKFVNKELLEADSAGAYRLRPKEEEQRPRVFVTPEIAAMLRRTGKQLKVDIGEKEPDEYELFLRKERYDASSRGKGGGGGGGGE